MAFIYIIHCSTSGKKYVGQTRQDPAIRMRQHFKKKSVKANRSPRLYAAMDKYGRDKFVWGIVEECNDDLINERECAIIQRYDTYNNGYNSNEGGSSVKRHSPATRAKMSATWKAKGTSNRKGKKNSEESNRKRRETFARRKAQGLPVGAPKGTTPWNKGQSSSP